MVPKHSVIATVPCAIRLAPSLLGWRPSLLGFFCDLGRQGETFESLALAAANAGVGAPRADLQRGIARMGASVLGKREDTG